jgi:PIN domain nuclease of toxin-antitoxin system
VSNLLSQVRCSLIPFPGGRNTENTSSHWAFPPWGIRIRHIPKLAGLPELHKDPFDRILVAQALAEGLTLATKDAMLARYGAPVVWE